MPSPTIYDVAKAAGVSYQTVSRVLNNRHDVADATRERIKKIMAEMQFVPHAAFRTLRSGRFNALGHLGMGLDWHAYWSKIAFGMQLLCNEKGMAFILGRTGADLEDQWRQLGILLAQGVDGIVVDPWVIRSEIIQGILEKNVPLVGLHVAGDGAFDVARVDESGGVRALTELLLERGYRRIGLLNGPPRDVHAQMRQRGYEAALAQAGIPLDETILRYTEGWRIEASRCATLELLDLSAPPDALLAAGPHQAIGAIAALGARHIQVPEEMAVATHNDGIVLPERIPYTECEPIEQVGYHAAQMLLGRIAGYDGPAREYVLPYQLYPGASSG